MRGIVWIAVLTVIVLIGSVGAAFAEWPATMEVGGFTITGISGTTSSDSSGRAMGRLSIWGDASCPIDLVRSGSGLVTGSTRSSFVLSGVRMDGSFLLDRRGLQGTGAIHTAGRPVTDANISIGSRGELVGQGRVCLGQGFSVGVQFEMSPQGLLVRGTAPRQAFTDTPLAIYTFKGDIELSSSGNTLRAVAHGNIERKGKIGGMINSFGPMAFDVGIPAGEAKVNVGGATVDINLW